MTMPMIDVTLPQDALGPAQQAALLTTLTDALRRAEGQPETSPVVPFIGAYIREAAPQTFSYGGRLAQANDKPRYRVEVTVPEGVLDRERKAALVEDATRAVIAAEGTAWSDESRFRVTCIIREVVEGYGVGGQVFNAGAGRAS